MVSSVMVDFLVVETQILRMILLLLSHQASTLASERYLLSYLFSHHAAFDQLKIMSCKSDEMNDTCD